MKHKYFLIFTTIISTLFTACTNELEEGQLGESFAQYETHFRTAQKNISLASELDLFTFNSVNGIATQGGFYWNNTYSNIKFQTNNFTFSHTSSVITGYDYWDGFTISNVADTTNYGEPGNSQGWVPHQWGNMAVPTGMSNKPNFLVGYWGYYMLDFQNPITATTTFAENKYATWVKLGTDSKQEFSVNKITVSIHPWPYYGILYGDGFARPFLKNDYFDLIVYGVKNNGEFVTKLTLGTPTNPPKRVPKTIIYSMADYRGDSLIMPTEWTDVVIDFGEPIKYLVFQMYSTDEDDIYGPNTAVYFCLRDIVMN